MAADTQTHTHTHIGSCLHFRPAKSQQARDFPRDERRTFASEIYRTGRVHCGRRNELPCPLGRDWAPNFVSLSLCGLLLCVAFGSAGQFKLHTLCKRRPEQIGAAARRRWSSFKERAHAPARHKRAPKMMMMILLMRCNETSSFRLQASLCIRRQGQ